MNGTACLVGSSDVIHELRTDLELATRADGAILITGEAGVGKRLLAELIHQRRMGRGAPFVVVRCEADGGLRFASVDGPRLNLPSAFEHARGGSLLIHGIDRLGPREQDELAGLIDTTAHRITRGLSQHDTQGVRVLAATSRNLYEYVHRHRFSEHLYYRLNVVHLRIPSLRERRQDVPELIHWLLRRRVDVFSPPRSVAPEAQACLLAYDWPGNLAELNDVLERLLAPAQFGAHIRFEHLPAQIRQIELRAERTVVAPRASDTQTTSSMHTTAPASPSEWEVRGLMGGQAIRSAKARRPADDRRRRSCAKTARGRRRRTMQSAVSLAAGARRRSRESFGHPLLARWRSGWVTAAVLQERLASAPVAGRIKANARRVVVPFVYGIVAGGVVMLFVAAPFGGKAAEPPSAGATVAASSPGASHELDAANPGPSSVAPTTFALPESVAIVSSLGPRGGDASDEMAPADPTVFRGSLRVDSHPRGARVFVNGRAVGTTPLDLRNLPVGSRAVRLELDGHESWTSVVRVVSNERAYVDADLFRIAESQEAQPAPEQADPIFRNPVPRGVLTDVQ